MDTDRAREVLEAIRFGRPPGLTGDDLARLAQGGLVVSTDRAARDRLASQAEGLPGLTERIHELARSVHGWTDGTGVFLGASGAYAAPGAQEGLRAAMDELEELARARAVVESLVWNDLTESLCSLTLDGRRALADLQNWAPPMSGLSFEEFRARLANYRTSLAQAVERADLILRTMADMRLLDAMPDFTRADLRLASIALSMQPGDRFQIANEFASLFTSSIWQATRREDRLMGSVILAALPGDAAAAVQAFQQVRYQTGTLGIPPDEDVIVAASLADLAAEHRGVAIARLAAMRAQRPGVGPVALAGVARSPYPVEEALRRLDDVAAGLGRLGYADGEQIWASSAILASSRWPLDAGVERFRQVAGRLPGAFYSPLVAGALLATGPLEPTQAVESLEECIGAVTRGNFFDLTVEIESLALILSHVVAPLDLRSAVAGTPPPMLPAPPMVAAPLSAWFVPHSVWVYRPIVRYIASHPAHVHTIAGFA